MLSKEKEAQSTVGGSGVGRAGAAAVSAMLAVAVLAVLLMTGVISLWCAWAAVVSVLIASYRVASLSALGMAHAAKIKGETLQVVAQKYARGELAQVVQ